MNESYAYDARSRIRQWTKEGVTVDYGYDDLGNLTLHAGEVQVYDDPTRPHAIQQRGTSTTPVRYAYDDDGNVESILGGPTARHFRYDSANRIVCVGTSASTCGRRVAYDISGKRIAEYASGRFDAYVGDSFLYEDTQVGARASVEIMLDGKRIALERFDPQMRGSTAGLSAFELPGSWAATGLAYGGMLLVLLGARSGAFILVRARPARAFTAIVGIGSLLLPSVALAGGGAMAAAEPGYYWEIVDPLGTGMVLFDEDGSRVRHQVFTPFGRIHSEVGAHLRTFYAGHRRDDQTGHYYMQARWYDPDAGRFLSTDPVLGVGLPQSHNPYSYVLNNPVNSNDPTGLWPGPWSGPSGRPFIFMMYGLGWINTTTTTTTVTDTSTGTEWFTSTEVSHEGSVAGGTDGLTQEDIDAIGGRAMPRGQRGVSKVEMVYVAATGAPGAKHGYVLVTSPEGEQFGVRAGPSGREDGSGSPAASGGRGIFGNLVAEAGPYNETFTDYGAKILARQTVLTTTAPYDRITAVLAQFARDVNASEIRYNPLSTNSNAFAHQAVTTLGAARPPPIVWAPGWSTILILR
jgi:RHS repeat-associated protein